MSAAADTKTVPATGAARTPIAISDIKVDAAADVKLCFVLRGLSGSGKSSLTKHLVSAAAAHQKKSVICSADLFFSNGGTGPYRFDPRKLGEAHAFSLSTFVDACAAGTACVIVDNTASKKWEYSNYGKIAAALGYKVTTLEISCPDEQHALFFNSRNTHGVPAAGALGMWNGWEADASAVLIQPFKDEAAWKAFTASQAAAPAASAPAASHHHHGGGGGGAGKRTPPRSPPLGASKPKN